MPCSEEPDSISVVAITNYLNEKKINGQKNLVIIVHPLKAVVNLLTLAYQHMFIYTKKQTN